MVYTNILPLTFTILQFTFITTGSSPSDDNNKNQGKPFTFKEEIKLIECAEKQSINDWVNNLPVIKTQDDNILDEINNINLQRKKDSVLSQYLELDGFQHILAMPLQSICNVGKWFSLTKWLWRCGATDGERYICMDNFTPTYKIIHVLYILSE